MISLQQRMELALRHSGKRASALANVLDISESAVSQWLNGPTKSVNSTLVIKAAHFLEVSAYWFATGEGNMLQTPSVNESAASYTTISDEDHKLLARYRQLSDDEKSQVTELIDRFSA